MVLHTVFVLRTINVHTIMRTKHLYSAVQSGDRDAGVVNGQDKSKQVDTCSTKIVCNNLASRNILKVVDVKDSRVY